MNRIDFWNEQAAKGAISGTQDRIAKELEMKAIAAYVKDGMRVLDVGCGDGETLRYLGNQSQIKGFGIDYSKEMIAMAEAKGVQGLIFAKCDVKDLKSLFVVPDFDLIYTQRCLINLATWEEQRQAILDIASLLKPGGLYLMVENFQDGLDEINAIREGIGLPAISPPWHNLYLKLKELHPLCKELIFNDTYEWPMINYFSAAYFFMSRVVNAWLAAQQGRTPEYDTTVNRLGAMLDPGLFRVKGQTQMWVWRKL